jgi:transcriptional regulator GlxA family with amidase domain
MIAPAQTATISTVTENLDHTHRRLGSWRRRNPSAASNGFPPRGQKLRLSPADAAALAAGIEREILWRLLTGPQGTTVRQLGLYDSRLVHLARAISCIRKHYNEKLRVEELAALATMSVSAFHRHFRALTTMTPIQFQKQIRLYEARARLLADPYDIAGIGYAVGYDRPSQFSREYRRAFGVPPSRHVPALRVQTTAD